MTIPTITDDLIAEIEAEFQNACDKGLTAYVDPKDGLALTAHIRQLEKDAARYRKLRNLGFLDRMVPLHVCDEHLRADKTDEYIDAMQATQ